MKTTTIAVARTVKSNKWRQPCRARLLLFMFCQTTTIHAHGFPSCHVNVAPGHRSQIVSHRMQENIGCSCTRHRGGRDRLIACMHDRRRDRNACDAGDATCILLAARYAFPYPCTKQNMHRGSCEEKTLVDNISFYHHNNDGQTPGEPDTPPSSSRPSILETLVFTHRLLFGG